MLHTDVKTLNLKFVWHVGNFLPVSCATPAYNLQQGRLIPCLGLVRADKIACRKSLRIPLTTLPIETHPAASVSQWAFQENCTFLAISDDGSHTSWGKLVVQVIFLSSLHRTPEAQLERAALALRIYLHAYGGPCCIKLPPNRLFAAPSCRRHGRVHKTHTSLLRSPVRRGPNLASYLSNHAC